MSTKNENARTISQPSNRAKPKDVKEKKVVFKGVLDNPFRIQWPSIPLNLQSTILSCMIELLESASDYHDKRCAESRKRKKSAKSTEKALKKTKLSEITPRVSSNLEDTIVSEKLVENTSGFSNLEQDTKPSESANIGNEPPLLLRHVLYGINAVTKRLETQAHNARSPTIATLPKTSIQPPKPLKYIFVCRADVDPALLIAHLPHLVAAYNSTRPSQYIKLIPLPQGAELVLAQTLGVRRVTVLGVDVDYPDNPRLKEILDSIPILTASWLSQPKAIAPLIPTHVKHLRTTAPKDMKEAKELRLQGKAAAKQKRLEKVKQT